MVTKVGRGRRDKLGLWDWHTHSVQYSSVQSLNCVQLFATPWIAARQASLSIANSWSLLKLKSIESVMPSNRLHPPSSPSPTFNLSQHQDLFQWVSSSHQVARIFSFSISPSNEYSELISFRMDWFDLLAVQGTLKSLLQHHSSKASIQLWWNEKNIIVTAANTFPGISRLMEHKQLLYEDQTGVPPPRGLCG